MGYGRLGRESASRLFAADEDHLYEFHRTTAAWEILSAHSLPIRPNFLLTAAVRKDGLNRLYMVANDRNRRSLVHEYSPVSRQVSVAAQDFRFDTPERETWMEETGEIVGGFAEEFATSDGLPSAVRAAADRMMGLLAPR